MALGLHEAAVVICCGMVLGLHKANGAGADGPLAWAPDFPAEESCHAVAELIGSCPPKLRSAMRNRLIESLGGLVPSWQEMITQAADAS